MFEIAQRLLGGSSGFHISRECHATYQPPPIQPTLKYTAIEMSSKFELLVVQIYFEMHADAAARTGRVSTKR